MTPENITIEQIIEKFERDDVYYNTEGSEISKFFAGKCVFLTGGTGFLGRLTVEKLLRACPDIASILLLVRPKKGKDPHTRLDEICNDVVFQKLAIRQPKFRHKIALINGDISLPGLGMTIEDRQLVIEKASIFIHGAATVKFTEKLNLAVDINIKGTLEILSLAKECKQIDCFVHISTAFTFCTHNEIDEKVYDTPMDVDKILQICNATPPQALDKITEDLLGEWPNTYVFTKAIAEDCVSKCASQFPIAIVRPAVVTATYKEPIKSWIDNIYGATGIVVGCGVGLLRTANIKTSSTAEIVPADMVVNSIIAACHKTAMEKKHELSVYNYVSSIQNRLEWKRFMDLNGNYGIKGPTVLAFWIYYLVLTENVYLYNILTFLLHTIPAALVDFVLLVTGKKPQLINIYKKIHKFGATLRYFANKNLIFRNKNTQNLYENLSETDKKLFFFDMSKLDWNEYFTTHCWGLRLYILKDKPESLPQAKKKYFRMKIAHYTIQIVLTALILRLVYALLSYFFL